MLVGEADKVHIAINTRAVSQVSKDQDSRDLKSVLAKLNITLA